MAISKAQKRAVAKYEAKAYDKTLIRLPKGRFDEIKTHTGQRSESINGFINRAILERDNAADGAAVGPTGAKEQAKTHVLSEKPAERP